MEIRKKATFLKVINNPIIYKFFKDFTNLKKRPTGWQFLTVDLSSTFLNTGTTNEIFQQSGKQDSSRHILKSSASMYESSGSQFFRTTTGIQSGPDAFDKSRFITIFLTILGVLEILCSFNLVLEGKTRKETAEPSRLEFKEKFSANKFCFIRCRRQHLQPVEQRRQSRFTFVEDTISKSLESQGSGK